MSLITVIKGWFPRKQWDQTELNGNQAWSDFDIHMDAPFVEDSKCNNFEEKETKRPNNKSFDEILRDKIAFFESLPSLK